MTMERGLFMPYIPANVVSRAKQMDLYTYLHDYEPQELVHLGGGTYCTREHDSLKISNGKWYWFSQSIGGRSALDYLIKVRGTPFKEAVETIVGRCAAACFSATKGAAEAVSSSARGQR